MAGPHRQSTRLASPDHSLVDELPELNGSSDYYTNLAFGL